MSKLADWRSSSLTLTLVAMLAATPARAQEDALQDSGEPASATGPAASAEFWSSTDSDQTDVVKLLARGLWSYGGADHYQGIAVERAWFRPLGQRVYKHERVYLDLADGGEHWRWRARIGIDGDTILGSANLRRADWSKELFVDREIVETPRGVNEGIYYTLLGASLDLPAGQRDLFTAMAGIQEFTGKNERLHLRGSYVRVVRPEIGLSAQLRARYFHSTSPGEFDYYSPRDFLQLLPVLQMRRFDNSGWMYLGALGYGTQRATGTGWRDARLIELRIESPRKQRDLQAFAQLQYSNASLTGAGDYHYVLGRLGLTMGF